MKSCFCQSRQPRRVGRAQTFLLEIEWWQQAALNHHAIRRLACPTDPQARERKLRRVAGLRSIEDLAILQVSATAQPDSASSDPAQWTRDSGEMSPSEHARKCDLAVLGLQFWRGRRS